MTVESLAASRVDGPLRQLEPGIVAETWQLYSTAFADLSRTAIQRHLMYPDEFRDMMADQRVHKYLHFTGRRVDGLATYTNELGAVPLISPAYFAYHWPDLYRAMRIWYVPFLAVPEHAPGVYAALLTAMHAKSGPDAVTCLDVCDERARLPESTRLLLERISGRVVTATDLGAQRYWGLSFH